MCVCVSNNREVVFPIRPLFVNDPLYATGNEETFTQDFLIILKE